MPDFEQCECGAWRPVTESEGRTVWASGCAACNKIRRLRQLLSEGVHVYKGDSAETLRGKLDRAEAEIERLNKLLNSLHSVSDPEGKAVM